MFDLRSWLRRSPKPSRIRITTADGEERTIELGDKRFRWNACEETVRTSGAVTAQCLDKEGNILRATRLSEEDTEAGSDEEARDKYGEKLVSKERREMGYMLDRYGARMNEAFHAGAAAAAVSQDSLVTLVTDLTGHLSMAITNLHTVSVNLANIVTAHASEGDEKGVGALIAQMVAGKALGAATAEVPNGKGRGK